MRKSLGPLLAALLVLGAIAGGVYSYRQKHDPALAQGSPALVQQKAQTLRVLTGSEKVPFLTDPELAKVLAAKGFALDVQKAGSREIAGRADLKTFDIAFPAGAPAATKIQQATGSKHVYASYYTPMAVASWKPLLKPLQSAGIVSRAGGAWYIVDMHKLLALMEKGARWRDLSDNPDYAVGKSILINTTDVRKSNSAAMYLALTSYLVNGDNVVDSNAAAVTAAGKLASLFSRQGYQESSSAGPFEDYLSMKMGKAPLVLVYEQQFLEYAFAHPTIDPDMVLLYPQPTVLTKHTMVALSDRGAQFAQLMETDPEIQRIAQAHGFRGADTTLLFRQAAERKLELPKTLVDVVDPPSYDLLEKMIVDIDQTLSR